MSIYIRKKFYQYGPAEISLKNKELKYGLDRMSTFWVIGTESGGSEMSKRIQ